VTSLFVTLLENELKTFPCKWFKKGTLDHKFSSFFKNLYPEKIAYYKNKARYQYLLIKKNMFLDKIRIAWPIFV